MSRVTRFSAADPGPAARISGFVAHLRENGFRIGVAETDTALAALCKVNASDPNEARLALKSVCAGTADDAAQFDLLFDSFWLNEGRVRQKTTETGQENKSKYSRSSKEDKTRETSGKGTIHAPDDSQGDGESNADGTGKLIASQMRNMMKKDLRELVGPDDIYAAEQMARRLGKALHDRRSRRRKRAQKGQMIDLRRTLRRSIATGGEPLRLAKRKRPDRALKIVALCDVSGSMMLYARPFLAFLAGLMRSDKNSDAYMFHTRLVRVTEALRDDDPLRALNRITLLADGFGGGSKIGLNLLDFARSYARKFVDGRSVVMIFSDGYDCDAPEILDAALAKLKKRGCKIIWVNPLKGWANYAPIARGMAAALPHLDHFAAASTLNDLADLEKRFSQL